jgi:hypothetical protein
MSISRLVRYGVVPRIALVAFVFVCIALMFACEVRSLNGLAERDNDPDMVYDARLTGTWPDAGEKCTSTVTISAHEKVYSWQVVDCATNKKTSFESRLFKLDEHYFLDMTAPSEEVCNLCIGIHLIYLVQFGKDSVGLVPLDSDWFKTAVQNKSVNLTTLPDDPGLITSPPEDLKAFCRKYADNKEAFKVDSAETLKRGPGPTVAN